MRTLLALLLTLTLATPVLADDGWDMFDCIGPRLADLEACRAPEPAEFIPDVEVIEVAPPRDISSIPDPPPFEAARPTEPEAPAIPIMERLPDEPIEVEGRG